MKKIIPVIILMVCATVTYSQSASPKKSLDRIDYSDKDTVLPRYSLTREQTFQIYSVNIQLGQQERDLQQKYPNADSLSIQMKVLEEKKDALYKSILPQDKYQLFKQKKLKLMSHDLHVMY